MAYANPFRAIKNLVAGRVDQGVDYHGIGPVFALGNGVVTVADNGGSGWPGAGGYVQYRLSDGPYAGKLVYVAEDVTIPVHVGQQINTSTVVANMTGGSTGIEIGFASGSGTQAEAAAAGQAGSPSHANTAFGNLFNQVLASVGAPPGKLSGAVIGNTGSWPSAGAPQSGGGGGGGLFDISGLVDLISQPVQDVDKILTAFVWFFKPENWVRILAGLAAFVILAIGLNSLYKAAV